MKLKFKYGQKVVDKVTHFRGKVTGYCHYYNERPDCYLVESIDNTGRPIEQWVDEERLEED